MKKSFLLLFCLALSFSFNGQTTEGDSDFATCRKEGTPEKRKECYNELKALRQSVNPINSSRDRGWCFEQHQKDPNFPYEKCIQAVDPTWTPSNPGVDCFRNMKDSYIDGIGDDHKAYLERSNKLNQAARERYETLKSCRRELRESYLDFQKKSDDVRKETNLLPIKIRKNEISFQEEVNRIKRECRAKANEDFEKYQDSVLNRANIGPHQLHGMADQINSHRDYFYQSCVQAPENVKAVEIARQKLAVSCDEARVVNRTNHEILNSARDQLALIQEDILEECEDRKKLNAYNEQMANHISSSAMRNNRTRKVLRFTDNMLSCLGDRTLSIPNPLRGTSSTQ